MLSVVLVIGLLAGVLPLIADVHLRPAFMTGRLRVAVWAVGLIVAGMSALGLYVTGPN